MKLPVFERTLRSCRTSDRGFALAEDLVSLLKNVQIQYRVAVSLGSFIRQAVVLRESWMRDVCARGAASASHPTIGHGTFSYIRPATRSFLQKLLRSSMTANLGLMPRMSSQMCNLHCNNTFFLILFS